MKLLKDRAVFYIDFLSIEIYWPKIIYNNSDIGLYAHSQISMIRKNEWTWFVDWAFVLKVLGFGFGFAWKHCDNPNIKNKD